MKLRSLNKILPQLEKAYSPDKEFDVKFFPKELTPSLEKLPLSIAIGEKSFSIKTEVIASIFIGAEKVRTVKADLHVDLGFQKSSDPS